ncbi:Transposase DDE domain-containing protein [Bacillus sp. OV322]|uniref:transposase n=1 Tax=Bacillus sp. OV322 TaxID=1882764 RepID=UPI0008E68844|nr:Transposase DDE domain-containing protein [Bacillus sp. OV322]
MENKEDDDSTSPKAKDGKNRKIYYNEKREQQKNKVKQQFLEEKIGSIYAQRKTDVEPAFANQKAKFRFSRITVRGKDKDENELEFAFMARNLINYTAMNTKKSIEVWTLAHKGFQPEKHLIGTVLSPPFIKLSVCRSRQFIYVYTKQTIRLFSQVPSIMKAGLPV